MKLSTTKTGVSMMVVSTFLWGLMGISSRMLSETDLSSMEITFIRSISSAICLTILLSFTNRRVFKVSLKGFAFCAFYGILNYSIGMNFYSISVERIPIAVATVLMFSNPVWTTIFGKLFFGDLIDKKKIFAISLCILGCMCIIDIFSTNELNLDLIGLLAGLLNGMTFSLQIVMPRFVENKIQKETLLLYGFMTSSICLFFFSDMGEIVESVSSSPSPTIQILNLVSIGVLSTFLANTLYVKSTKYIGTSLPSIMVAFEPIFAGILSLIIFGETLKSIQILGAIIVICAVILINSSLKKLLNKINILINLGLITLKGYRD